MLELLAAFSVATTAFSIPPGLLPAMCWVESNHRPRVINVVDGTSASYGMCQIKLMTARHMGFRGSPLELLRPGVNAYYAAKYLKYNIDRCGSVHKGVEGYNRGNCGPSKAYLRKVVEAHGRFSKKF